MSSNKQNLADYFSVSGARLLLSCYAGFPEVIPDDASTWRADLFPMMRGIWNSQVSGGRSIYEISTELRRVADLFEQYPDGSHRSLKNLPKSESGSNTPTTYRQIADYVEQWLSPSSDEELYAIPMTSMELHFRFPRLDQILPIYFGQDGVAVSDKMQDASAEEGILMYISETHPRCPWQLPGAVAECSEALTLFHTEEQLDDFFSYVVHGGSGSEDFTDFFPLFIRLCTEHLKEAHSPLWHWQKR